MTTYTLKRISKSVYSVTSERKKVGFVNACPRGFAARIGAHYEVRTTAQAASEAVASKALGFNNAAEVREHNREVRVHNRAVNRANREAARPIVDQMLAGNFDPLFELMKRS